LVEAGHRRETADILRGKLHRISPRSTPCSALGPTTPARKEELTIRRTLPREQDELQNDQRVALRTDASGAEITGIQRWLGELWCSSIACPSMTPSAGAAIAAAKDAHDELAGALAQSQFSAEDLEERLRDRKTPEVGQAATRSRRQQQLRSLAREFSTGRRTLDASILARCSASPASTVALDDNGTGSNP
jgi:hypothetical protein